MSDYTVEDKLVERIAQVEALLVEMAALLDCDSIEAGTYLDRDGKRKLWHVRAWPLSGENDIYHHSCSYSGMREMARDLLWKSDEFKKQYEEGEDE